MVFRSILFVFILYIAGSEAVASSTIIDSLDAVLQNVPKDKRMDAYQDLIVRSWLNHPDIAMRYARNGMHLASSTKRADDLSVANRLMGGVHLYLGNYDSALLYSQKAYQLSLVTSDSMLIASSLNNIGYTYYHFGSYLQAMDNLTRALALKLRIGQDYGLGQTYNNLGLVFEKLKDLERARDCFNKAIETSARLHDDNIKLYSFNNLGFTSLHAGEVSKAHHYFQQALVVSKNVSNKNWLASSYSGLGQVYLERNSVDSAEMCFQKSLALRHSINDKRGISEVYYYYAKICFRRHQIDTAFRYLYRSQFLGRQHGMRERRKENMMFLATLHKERRSYDSALFYTSAVMALRDSLFDENLARDLAAMQVQSEQDENERRLFRKDTQLRQQKGVAFALASGLLLIGAFLFVLYRSFRRLQKLTTDIAQQKEALRLNNEELHAAKEYIQFQNHALADLNLQLQSKLLVQTKELETTNQELKVVSAEFDDFIYRSSHDIKGPLARILGLCHVGLVDIHDEKAREYFERLYQTAHHLNRLLDSLKAASEIKQLKLKPRQVDLHEILDNAMEKLPGADVKIIRDIDEKIEWHTDATLLGIIVRDMLDNTASLRVPGQENNFIRISFRKDKSHVLLSFTSGDSNNGPHESEDIFKRLITATEHQSFSLGLYIVQVCVERLKGSIELVYDSPFSQFRIRLPQHLRKSKVNSRSGHIGS